MILMAVCQAFHTVACRRYDCTSCSLYVLKSDIRDRNCLQREAQRACFSFAIEWRKCATSSTLHDPVATGQHLDKYSLEDYARIQGGGEAALETVKIWTRVMLGTLTMVSILEDFVLISQDLSHHKSAPCSSSIIAKVEEA
jgi:hypothetical protein